MSSSTIEIPDFKELRAKELNFYLFGEPIAHSKAPLLHNSVFNELGLNWRYSLFESSNVPDFKEKLYADNCIGSAVTMPNKVVFAEHVDKVDSEAQGVGAINTVYTRKDKETGKEWYIGTNTDTIGVRDAFLFNEKAAVEANKGKPGLVYGGGGACRSAIYALYAFLGCSKVYIVNRFASEVEAVQKAMKEGGFEGEIVHVYTPEQAAVLEKPGLIVLTVPDFAPSTPEEKLAKSILDVFITQEDKGAVLEMCYHPKPATNLYVEFEKNGWKVISGIEAMIYQGFAQQILWTGYTIDQLPTKAVIDIIYKDLGVK